MIDNGSVTMSEEQHQHWLTLRTVLYDKEWIVDFKEPMGGAAQDFTGSIGSII
jgi:hypothetical protein